MSNTECGRIPFQVVEIEQPSCSLVYGVGACTAAVGTTGTQKCFNTLASCQDSNNYSGTDLIKWRFIEPMSQRPPDYYSNSGGVVGAHALPLLTRKAATSPTVINVGGGNKKISPFGIRAALAVSISDCQYDDSIGDPYVTERTYDPYSQGTFWGKWLARNKYYNNYVINVYDGYFEESLGSMVKRTYLIEKIDVSNSKGTVTITAKDPLRIADDKRSLVPHPIDAKLVSVGGIDDSQTTGILVQGNILELQTFHGIIDNVGDNYLKYFFRLNDEIISCKSFDGATSIDPALGLTSFWRLDENTGTALSDEILTYTANIIGTTKPVWSIDSRYLYALDFISASTDAAIECDTLAIGEMTVGAWVKITDLTGGCILFGHKWGANAMGMYYLSEGGERFWLQVRNVGFVITGFTPVQDKWYHVAVSIEYISGNSYNYRIYINGTLYITVTTSLSSGQTGGVMYFGNVVGGLSVTSTPLNGLIDDCFYSDSVLTAAQITDIKDGALGYVIATYELFNVVRGDLNSTAATHDEDDKVSRVAHYECDVHVLANDLLTTYAQLPSGYIPYSDWVAEFNDHLPSFNLTGSIAEPVSVNKLMGELSEQCLVNWWWDERDSEVKMLAIRPTTDTPSEWSDDFNIIRNSTNIKSDPSQRISRLFIYYGKYDATRKDDETGNWSGVTARVDSLAETQYGEAKTRIIYSRWLSSNALAFQVAVRLLSRYRDEPRYLKVSVDAKDRDDWTGDVVRITTAADQDFTGATVQNYWQIISAVEKDPGHSVSYELQQFEFGGVGDYGHYMESTANDWDSATDAEKDNGAWYTDTSGDVPSDNSPGYPMQ